MPLPTWTTPPSRISLANVQAEFGGSNPIRMSEYYSGGSYVAGGTTGTPNGVAAAIPASGRISLKNFIGSSGAGPTTTTSTSTTTTTTTAAPTTTTTTTAAPTTTTSTSTTTSGPGTTTTSTSTSTTTTTTTTLGPPSIDYFIALNNGNVPPFTVNETSNRTMGWSYSINNRAGRTLYWKLDHFTTTDSDFDGATFGPIYTDSGGISVTVRTDAATEGNETFGIKLYSDAFTTVFYDWGQYVTITDSSTAAPGSTTTSTSTTTSSDGVPSDGGGDSGD